MRAIIIFAILLGFVGTAAADAERNVLKLPGGTLTAPDGFVWKKMRQETKGGRTMVTYGAMNKETRANLVLSIIPEKAEKNEERIEVVVNYVEGTMDALKKAGAKNVKLTPPDLRAPLGDKVEFTITLSNPRDESFVISGRVFFTNKTYLIQGLASSNQEAEALVRVTDSLSE